MVHLENKDYQQLIGLLVNVPQLQTEQGCRQMLEIAGLGEFVARIKLSNNTLTVVSQITSDLCKYGRVSDGQESLGLFLSTLKDFTGMEQRTVLDGLLSKYGMMDMIAPSPDASGGQKYPVIMLPSNWRQMSKRSQTQWLSYNLIDKLPQKMCTLLVWCSLANWFNAELLKELLCRTELAMNFTEELWLSLKDLPIIQESPELFSNSYQIFEPYRQWLQEYIPTKKKQRIIHHILSEGFAECIVKEDVSRYKAFYRVEEIIHNIKSNPENELNISSEILAAYKYEPRLRQRILKALSPENQYNQNRFLYFLVLFIPNIKNPFFTFLIPRVIEKISNSFLLTSKFSLPLLYVSSLFYQTWAHNEDAIRAIRLALERNTEEGSKLEGKLRSRLALSLIFIGNMDEAEEQIKTASRIFDANTEDWIENELNRQIFYLKCGYWQQSLELGKSLEPLIKNDLQKAKHTHLLGVNFLHFGNLKEANKYAEISLELASHLEGLARLTAWLIGKEWRKRFAYALLANIKLARSLLQDSSLAEQYYNLALKLAKKSVRQAPAILAYTARPISIYLEASIAALRQDFDKAIFYHLQLQGNEYVEEYYRLASKIDLGDLYLRLDRTSEAIDSYVQVLEQATESGFKYLEIRALRRLIGLNVEIDRELPALLRRLEQLTENQPPIGSDYVDRLEFMLPM